MTQFQIYMVETHEFRCPDSALNQGIPDTHGACPTATAVLQMYPAIGSLHLLIVHIPSHIPSSDIGSAWWVHKRQLTKWMNRQGHIMESGEVPKDICYTGCILWICCWNCILLRYASIITSVTLLVYDGLWILADMGQTPGTLVFTWCSCCPWCEFPKSKGPVLIHPQITIFWLLVPILWWSEYHRISSWNGWRNYQPSNDNFNIFTQKEKGTIKKYHGSDLINVLHPNIIQWYPYIHDIINLHQPGHHRPSDFKDLLNEPTSK